MGSNKNIITEPYEKWYLQAIEASRLNSNISSSGMNFIDHGRRVAIEKLKNIKFPTSHIEDYRFTDLSNLIVSRLVLPENIDEKKLIAHMENHRISKSGPTVVFSNGKFSPVLSSFKELPQGLYIGQFSEIESKKKQNKIEKYNNLVSLFGGYFACLNSATVNDALCIIVEPGLRLENEPLHLLTLNDCATSNSKSLNYIPSRLFVWLGEGAAIDIVEESTTIGKGNHMSNMVAEFYLSKDAKLSHKYIQLDKTTKNSYHFKSTMVGQEQNSHYECIEVRTGLNVSRHDLILKQFGPSTKASMKHFMLAGNNQLLDLHSKIILNYRKGTTHPLHKSIVSHSTGQSVFDGNICVNKYAQKTDAKQLSRNLLTIPKATVSVKPNLQIIADDVKCSHGCTVSDIHDAETFYFASRGICNTLARKALVNSFAFEVVREIKYPSLRERIKKAIQNVITNEE